METPEIGGIFALSPHVRYVAVYRNGELNSKVLSEIPSASSPESDVYEELLVNPTLLTLVTQRGNIDCGGAKYLVIRYGHFFQIIFPVEDGHVSVCCAAEGDPVALALQVEAVLERSR